MSPILLLLLFCLTSFSFPLCSALLCHTDICSTDNSSCIVDRLNSCSGDYCFLEYSSNSNFNRYQRGCMNREYLNGEGEGCFILQTDNKKIFCQCNSTDFCNDIIRRPTHVTNRNISCDTGCNVTDVTISCAGHSNGPFCAYDPENRAKPYADFGESYFTPYGMFAGWTSDSTVCVRFIFPPFYYIRDVTCFCDQNFCDRNTAPIRAPDPFILCHGCYLDCHEAGEFCAPVEEMYRESTTCRGHYCVSHSVVDRVNNRLLFLGQYCLSTTRMLPLNDNVLTMNAERQGVTEIRVCRTGDYCNAFHYTGLSAEPPSDSDSVMLLANTWERLNMLRNAISTLLNAIISL